MENVLPKYYKPIASIDDPVVNVEHWDKAIDAFDEKNYKEAALEVIRYINSNALKDIDTSGNVDITGYQGSAQIQIHIDDKTFRIKAPFLKINDDTNTVALLRKVAEINFSALTLAQIIRHDNRLCFEYEMPIELAQPHKVYDLLWEVSVHADRYDDLLINNFNAGFIKEPQKKDLTPEERKEVSRQIQALFSDFENVYAYFVEKRLEDYKWELSALTLLKFSNMPYVHGQLRTDLISEISHIFNGDINFDYRADKAAQYIKKLMQKPEDEIFENIYHAHQFISLRMRSSEEIIAERLKNYTKTVESNRQKEKFMYQYYYLKIIFNKLIYDYNLEKDYLDAIQNTLLAVNDKDYEEAVPVLEDLYFKMLNKELTKKEEKPKKKGGFFSNLFN